MAQACEEARTTRIGDALPEGQEVADLLGLSLGDLRKARLRGQLPRGTYWRIGRRVRYSRQRLLAWIESGGATAEEPQAPMAA
jgi:hypothetical protein